MVKIHAGTSFTVKNAGGKLGLRDRVTQFDTDGKIGADGRFKVLVGDHDFQIAGAAATAGYIYVNEDGETPIHGRFSIDDDGVISGLEQTFQTQDPVEVQGDAFENLEIYMTEGTDPVVKNISDLAVGDVIVRIDWVKDEIDLTDTTNWPAFELKTAYTSGSPTINVLKTTASQIILTDYKGYNTDEADPYDQVIYDTDYIAVDDIGWDVGDNFRNSEWKIDEITTAADVKWDAIFEVTVRTYEP